jgi:protocatechuate 3,4-dioxygenase beta subunit
MTRRDALFALGAGALAVTARTNPLLLAAQQVDQDWLRMWKDAQKERPATIPNVARIAPVSEPGMPLVFHGRLFAADGVTPVNGGIVFAYHTDNQGLYRSVPNEMWRLKGWARTSPTGDFEFRTIRPAPYPGRKVAAHIHMTIEGPGIVRQSSGIQFADDPLVTAADRASAREAGRFSDLAVVETREGVQYCSLLFRPTGKSVF